MSSDGVPKVIANTEGCGAGMPLADLMYCVAMSRVLVVFRRTLVNDNLQSQYVNHNNEHICLKEVSFHDDVAVPSLAPASEIIEKTAAIAKVAINVFRLFYLSLNWKSNKSEGMVFFWGKGAKIEKNKMFANGNHVVLDSTDGEVELRFVSKYVHLGSNTVPVASNSSVEVSLRSNIIKSESRKLHSKLFANNNVSIKRKLNISKAYILSKGTHHVCTWPFLRDTQARIFHGAVMNMYRRATGQLYDSHLATFSTIGDEDMVYQHDLITPDNVRKGARLLLLARLVGKDVSILLDVVVALQHFKGTWSSAVLQDLLLLAQCGVFPTMLNVNDLVEWVTFARSLGKKFYYHINKHFSHSFTNVCLPKHVSTQRHLTICCAPCGLSFATIQAHALHNFKVHRIKNILRQYVGAEVHCTVCLKLFWTRERLINVHLRRSRICNAMLVLGPPTYSAEQADEFDSADKLRHTALQRQGQRRHKAVEPCVQLQGPLQPIINMRESKHHPLGYGHTYV